MPRKKKRRTKPEVQHTHLAIRVDGYEADLEAAVNYYVYEPQYAFKELDDEPLYRFGARLEITGTSTYPADRAGDAYEVTIYGDNGRTVGLDLKLRDVQKRDDYGSPRYRSYRGKEIPVFDPPPGIGHLTKVRGEQTWQGWIWAKSQFMNALLVLLGKDRDLYMSIHECKVKRQRWVRSLSLQTTDPAEE